MKYEIRTRKLNTTGAMKNHIYRRFDMALRRYGNRIESVVLRLTDVNGPKGGEDKLLKASVRLKRGKPIHLKDQGSDFYSVVDCLAGRVGRKVSRLLDRDAVMERGGKRWAA